MKKTLLLLPILLLVAGALFASEVTVGTGSQQARVPMDMYYKNSLFECIYLSSELNIGASTITAISLYNNFSTNVGIKPVKIWLGNTTQANLSTGWIASNSLTKVFDGNANFPNSANTILITLSTPFIYTGGNLVMMVNRPMDDAYYASSDRFYCQTIGTNRARKAYSDTVTYDAAVPPSNSTLSGQFPKTTFTYSVEALGALQGTIYGTGNLPLDNATVSISTTGQNYTTTAGGTYSFAYVTEGMKEVSVSRHGYNTATQNVTIVANYTTTQDFTLTPLPHVTLSGKIVGNGAPTLGIPGAAISFTGFEPYSTTTDADGNFSLSVYANQTYDYNASATGYLGASGQAVVGATDYDMGNVVLAEIILPILNLTATEAADQSNVQLAWEAPGTFPGEWIHYDNGLNTDSIGTGSAVDFYVAIRYPASALTAYAGTSLQAVKVWPNSAGSFSIRVWTGGTSTAPGTLVVDQPFTASLASYNTVLLNTPVLITGTEELWFGMRCNVTTGYPAGCDAGPADNGFGNMIYFNNAWSTLIALAPTLDYNWNIQGYVGYTAPTKAEDLQLISNSTDKDRFLDGSNIWRVPVGEEANETAWTLLTPTPATGNAFTDNDWGMAVPGDYKWAVRSVYSGNQMGNVVISSPITRVVHPDIAAVLIGGNEDPHVGIPYTYTVEVKNLGNTVLLGSTYEVRLMNGSSDVDTQPGVDLAPGELHGFPLVWVPTDLGDFALTGLVDMQGDSVPTNNETDSLEVVVNDDPLPVVLSSFTALLTATNYVQLSWVTQSESGMIGYRVYRNETPDQSTSIQITDVIVPATNTSNAHSYTITDDEVSIGDTYYYWLESVDYNQSSFHGPVSVSVNGEVPPVLPEISTMRNAYPNPFRANGTASIEVGIKAGENGTVTIYNVHGQVVKTYAVSEGFHTLGWNGRDSHGKTCGSGIYFYRLSTPSVTHTRKLVLAK